MKERLNSALTLMQGILTSNQIQLGTQAEVQFKQAMNEIQGAIDAPDPEPKTVIQTEIVTSEMAKQVATQIQGWMGNVQSSLEGIGTRLATVENALVLQLDPIRAANDKLDGMEDTLAAFIASNSVPAAG